MPVGLANGFKVVRDPQRISNSWRLDKEAESFAKETEEEGKIKRVQEKKNSRKIILSS